MRLVIQRVTRASVSIDGETGGAIQAGLLVLVGVREGDDETKAQRLATKTAELRIFADEAGRFNRSLLDSQSGSGTEALAVLVVSQFTLYADTRRGRRPGFHEAAAPDIAEPLVEAYARALETLGVHVARGRFGADMQVELVNDGPVAIIIDSDDQRRPRRQSPRTAE